MKSILNFLIPKQQTFYLEADSTIRQVLEKFDAHKFSVVPLIDENGVYVTTISEGDILRFIKNICNFNQSLAEMVKIDNIEIYRPYKALSITASMEEVINLSLEQNFIPLVDDRNVFIGIIKRKEVIKYLIELANIN